MGDVTPCWLVTAEEWSYQHLRERERERERGREGGGEEGGGDSVGSSPEKFCVNFGATNCNGLHKN